MKCACVRACAHACVRILMRICGQASLQHDSKKTILLLASNLTLNDQWWNCKLIFCVDLMPCNATFIEMPEVRGAGLRQLSNFSARWESQFYIWVQLTLEAVLTLLCYFSPSLSCVFLGANVFVKVWFHLANARYTRQILSHQHWLWEFLSARRAFNTAH